ncbi:hypothetical protein PIB30_056298 [Stylosanthes scabra]|uniref:Uncharacterized protein n=1 Tax=Stylosanthes scabra TaxID=79078 RepID=A0ABU6YL57_9FABA|nr:hypothetical protein [Stylosanthes scabra]
MLKYEEETRERRKNSRRKKNRNEKLKRKLLSLPKLFKHALGFSGGNRKACKSPGTHQRDCLASLVQRTQDPEWGQCYGPAPRLNSWKNKAINEWPKGETNHLKLDRYDTISTRSHEDLDHPKLYKQGASPPQGTHSLTLHPILDLESHKPNSGLLGLFLYTSTSFSVIALGYAGEHVHRRHIFLL